MSGAVCPSNHGPPNPGDSERHSDFLSKRGDVSNLPENGLRGPSSNNLPRLTAHATAGAPTGSGRPMTMALYQHTASEPRCVGSGGG